MRLADAKVRRFAIAFMCFGSVLRTPTGAGVLLFETRKDYVSSALLDFHGCLLTRLGVLRHSAASCSGLMSREWMLWENGGMGCPYT